ncbi:PREDICTED: protein SGT1 homolog B [Theobroma cacao]|uniref:Protein SGT1 homolog n=1 Tax=Theobroma cacao TaxID=3641 RepID=A0AB32VDH0_THECC|nr:PREDICTED: protein SGT1 homolog B [Theobroma cacao]
MGLVSHKSPLCSPAVPKIAIPLALFYSSRDFSLLFLSCSLFSCFPPAMASDLETKAKEAFFDDHFQLALDLYSQAIELNPKNAELYADRAQANIKINNLTEAVADANKAIELDPSMSKAYLRKATACMKLEEYQTAKAALETGAALAPGESRFSQLIKECQERIAEETGDLPKQTLEEVTTNVEPATKVEPEKNVPNLVTVAAPSKLTYRHEFYQKPEEVVVTIFAKGIPRECVYVEYGEQILSVAIDAPGKDAFHFQPRLFGKIIPDKCRYDVLSTKIEIRLAKAEPIQWTSLEFSKEVTVSQRVNVSSVTGNQKPVYPSSKPKRVDWDKLEAQVKKEEKDEKLDGDAALNKFFRDIYQDADEDTRRAMQKSFVESNGTVLSTNWNEVGAKKVEGSPPDGMEMRKWEY